MQRAPKVKYFLKNQKDNSMYSMLPRIFKIYIYTPTHDYTYIHITLNQTKLPIF